MMYTYLLIDFFTIIVPFLFSFHPRLNFYKNWRAFFPAVIITGLIFVLWDIYFTSLGVWGFNPRYITGIRIGNLPVEEVLFFFCIPYACVFTYHCLNIFIRRSIPLSTEKILTIAFIIAFAVLSVVYHTRAYTTVTFTLLTGLLVIARFILRVKWLPKFYIIYLVLLLPFAVVNGLLTGTGLASPVVWYNGNEIIGIRIMTIPVEDIFYGMDLILMNLLIYHRLLRVKTA